MLSIEDAVQIDRAALTTIPTPAPTRTHKPVPHAHVIDAIQQKAELFGMPVTDQAFWAKPGKLDGRELPAANLFGTLSFSPPATVPVPAQVAPTIAVVNSHSKEYALTFLTGARVFVCSNGMMTGEVVIKRKHTSSLETSTQVLQLFDRFLTDVAGLGTHIERLRGRRITDQEAKATVVDWVRAGAFPPSHTLRVLDEYEDPSVTAFREARGTMWGLYNAATELLKSRKVHQQFEGFRALNTVLSQN